MEVDDEGVGTCTAVACGHGAREPRRRRVDPVCEEVLFLRRHGQGEADGADAHEVGRRPGAEGSARGAHRGDRWGSRGDGCAGSVSGVEGPGGGGSSVCRYVVETGSRFSSTVISVRRRGFGVAVVVVVVIVDDVDVLVCVGATVVVGVVDAGYPVRL